MNTDHRKRRLAAAVLCLAMVACGGKPPSTPSAQAPEARVVMLGSGTPNADPDHSGPALAVIAHGKVYLVDAGPGVVRRAAAAHAAGVEELAMPALSRVFLTHLHSDHTVGLPDLMLTPWVLDRSDPLTVYGPPGTAAMVDHLMQAYAADIDNRLHGLEPINKTGWRTRAVEVAPGAAYRGDGMTITAFAVHHGNWEHAYGYSFQTAHRRIVVSGDTVPVDEIVRQCNGCDVLVHEVYSTAGFKRRPKDWQDYHAHSHTSTVQLAQIALRAKPKLLVLYHQLYWGSSDDDLLREIRAAGYGGKVVSSRDLGVY
ncbi:MAG TPA: MBL fold metallo-hydrolase [Xanthomonadaceae bacterium]|jgi:ribonuclease BN (tRNA processing enzyme)